MLVSASTSRIELPHRYQMQLDTVGNELSAANVLGTDCAQDSFPCNFLSTDVTARLPIPSPDVIGASIEFEGAKEMKQGFTVGQIARTLRCHERSARLYLHEVNQAIDHYAENIGELIDLQTVLALCRRHQDSVLGRRLALLLQNI